MHVIKVRSGQREELVEFTNQVEEHLKDAGKREGICFLFVQHTTAGLTVNENADPDVPRDMLHALRTLVPQHGMGFRHGEKTQMLTSRPPSSALQCLFLFMTGNYYWDAGRVFSYANSMALASAK